MKSSQKAYTRATEGGSTHNSSNVGKKPETKGESKPVSGSSWPRVANDVCT